METIAHWISQYGYFGIFSLLVLGIVGLPVPDEWLLTFAGFLVYKHKLLLVPTFAAALLGSTCGITISYGIGRSLGFYLVIKYGPAFHITQERLDRAHKWFERVGTWSLMIGYFLPGVRHLTAVVAGASKLRPLVFGVFAYTGALFWVSSFISIGYFFGDKWSRVLEQIENNLGTIIWIALGLLAIYLFLRYRSKKTKPTR
jgi:membrane protein DedA with SNARE-associated domain